jgi:hypothetical protein
VTYYAKLVVNVNNGTITYRKYSIMDGNEWNLAADALKFFQGCGLDTSGMSATCDIIRQKSTQTAPQPPAATQYSSKSNTSTPTKSVIISSNGTFRPPPPSGNSILRLPDDSDTTSSDTRWHPAAVHAIGSGLQRSTDVADANANAAINVNDLVESLAAAVNKSQDDIADDVAAAFGFAAEANSNVVSTMSPVAVKNVQTSLNGLSRTDMSANTDTNALLQQHHHSTGEPETSLRLADAAETAVRNDGQFRSGGVNTSIGNDRVFDMKDFDIDPDDISAFLSPAETHDVNASSSTAAALDIAAPRSAECGGSCRRETALFSDSISSQDFEELLRQTDIPARSAGAHNPLINIVRPGAAKLRPI